MVNIFYIGYLWFLSPEVGRRFSMTYENKFNSLFDTRIESKISFRH
jgi:hypothetical protein